MEAHIDNEWYINPGESQEQYLQRAACTAFNWSKTPPLKG